MLFLGDDHKETAQLSDIQLRRTAHHLNMEQPAQLNRLVLEFLQPVERP